MPRNLWNAGNDTDAPDRYEVEKVGQQTVHIALVGNRKQDNPNSHNHFQNDRLSVISLPTCGIKQCQDIVQGAVKIAHAPYSGQYATMTAAAFDPFSKHLCVSAFRDSPAFLMLDDGTKRHALPIANRNIAGHDDCLTPPWLYLFRQLSGRCENHGAQLGYGPEKNHRGVTHRK